MTTTLQLKTHFNSTAFPEPEWKTAVERWYQLDAPAFMVCESYWRNKTQLTLPPDVVLVNSPQTSFATDQLFCKSLSPSKFVHTLPSVRTSALFQLMNWRGPSFSFIDTREKILAYGEELVQKKVHSNVWYVHVEETPNLLVDLYVIQAEAQ